jgi:hypothetical protein
MLGGGVDRFAGFDRDGPAATDHAARREAAELLAARLAAAGYEVEDIAHHRDEEMSIIVLALDAEILVGLSPDKDPARWLLHVQLRDPGMFRSTREKRLAILESVQRAAEDGVKSELGARNLAWS